jgi:hypothetical protein
VTALSGAFVAGPATADNAEAYLGSAAARGLNVSLVNPLDASQTLQATLGSASANVSSALTAEATGVGQVLPDLATTKKVASASAQSPTKDAGSECAKALGLADVVNLGLACGSASATVANNLPSAFSEGSVAGLTLDGQTALAGLNSVTTVIGSTLNSALDTVCNTIKGVSCDATTTVKDLVTSVLQTRTLDVSVGKSTSSVVTDANKVTSSAQASGAIIKILPLPQVSGLPSTDPIATIEVGSAKATAVYDRVAGQSLEPVADPALVRVRFNSTLTNALNVHELAVAPNQDVPILAGTPLESRIIVSGKQIVTNPDGSRGAIADGVKLRLLMPLGESKPGALDGGITLELAHAEAGVAGKAAHITPLVPNLETPRSDGPAELPRTGGTPWIPFVGVGVLGLAVLVRRTTVRAAASR